MTLGTKIECKCKQCDAAFIARVADRKRGWARFCSKSCKAKNQESRTGQYKELMNKRGVGRSTYTPDDYHNDIHPFSEEAFE